jgi:hypothetical protein
MFAVVCPLAKLEVIAKLIIKIAIRKTDFNAILANLTTIALARKISDRSLFS